MQTTDPVVSLGSANAEWDALARDLPKYLMGSGFRARVKAMPPFNVAALASEGETRRAMLALSYIGQAYQWCETEAAHSLPAVLAKPWHEVGKLVGRPPILSYSSYSIDNWRRLNPNGAVECGNIALLQCFWGAKTRSGSSSFTSTLRRKPVALDEIRAGIQQMYDVLARMPERCDPYVYFHRVRPYIFGWKNNPALPNGVVYEGVDELGSRGMTYRGETGAQSAIVPALDAVLSVEHERDELRDYLMEMRQYMPPAHVHFIEAVEAGPTVRKFVKKLKRARSTELFNRSVELLADFRAMHLQYASTYIFAQAQKTPGNPSAVGTGGTPFIPYLRKHRDETRNQTV